MRQSGILLPVFSLPSKYGIGCFSRDAYEFIDKLAKGGQSYWQILPLTPAGKAYSPYAPLSCFAGDPVYIDPETLYGKGLLKRADLKELEESCGANPAKVTYGKVTRARRKILKRAYANFCMRYTSDKSDELLSFDLFCQENAYWLDNYALYAALRQGFNDKPWTEWPQELRTRNSTALEVAKFHKRDKIRYHKWLQYEFNVEWQAILAYAHRKRIEIIGDIPIYASYESADCWTNPAFFKLGENLRPDAVSGCPPDAFNALGQVWENPLYDWKYIKKTGYCWWIERLRRSFDLYDVVRIDHARGLCSYYSIPAKTMDARTGKWLKGPGIDFFKAIKRELGNCRLIAEDLGYVTAPVRKMIEASGLPGMKVLQFGFDSGDSNTHIPDNIPRHNIAYTGTHDNDTLVGWYEHLSPLIADNVNRFIRSHFGQLVPDEQGMYSPREVAAAMTASVMMSKADICIIPIQDYLLYGSEARINTPGTTGGNWEWRLTEGAFTNKVARNMRLLTEEAKRLQPIK